MLPCHWVGAFPGSPESVRQQGFLGLQVPGERLKQKRQLIVVLVIDNEMDGDGDGAQARRVTAVMRTILKVVGG